MIDSPPSALVALDRSRCSTGSPYPYNWGRALVLSIDRGARPGYVIIAQALSNSAGGIDRPTYIAGEEVGGLEELDPGPYFSNTAFPPINPSQLHSSEIGDSALRSPHLCHAPLSTPLYIEESR